MRELITDLKVGDKVIYKVDGIVGEVECEVIEVLRGGRYRIRDIYGYTYNRFIFK